MEYARDILLGLLAVQRMRVPAAAIQRVAAEAATESASDFGGLLVQSGLLTPGQLEELNALAEAALRGRSRHAAAAAAAAVLGASMGAGLTMPEALANSLAAWEAIPSSGFGEAGTPGSGFGLELAETPGRYVEEREFALGGMGRILIAYDETLARDVVIKELLPKDYGESDSAGMAESPGRFSRSMLQRFLQEARVTGGLEHPSIVPVYELGRRLDGTPYYTMKLVRGKTLSKTISECKSLRERMRLLPHFVDLCQAVAYAHSRGVIHRDLKPANVMVGDFGETVVIDWGLAKRRGAHDAHRGALEHQLAGHAREDAADSGATAVGEILGTPLYMAPEQAAGRIDEVGERSDVYSLGVILYEIITGRAPYTCTTREETLRRVLLGEPDPLTDVAPNAPPDLAAVCQRAMEKEPGQRYESARELAEEVLRFLSGALVQAYEYRFSEQLVRFMKRRRKSLSAAAATLLVLLGIGVYSYVQVRYERDAAEIARHQAEGARGDAELARADATRALYGAYVALAAVHLGDARYDQARQLLEQCPPEYRRWEWGRLQFLCNQAYQSYSQDLDWNLRAAREGYTLDPARGRIILEADSTSFNVLHVPSGKVERHVDVIYSDGQLCQSRGGRWLLRRAGSTGWVSGDDIDKPVLTFGMLNHWAWSFTFSGDDRTLAVRTTPEIATFFDLESAKSLCAFNDLTLTLVRLTGDGHTAAILLDEGAMTRVTQGPLVFLDVTTGAERARSPVTAVSAIEFPPVGSRLITGSPHGEVTCWNSETGVPVWQATPCPGEVTALAFAGQDAGDEAASHVVVGALDGTVCVLDLATGMERARLKGEDGPVGALSVSPDGEVIAAAFGPRIRVWEWRVGRSRNELEGHSGAVVRLDFSACGRLLHSLSRTEMKLWNLENPGATQRLPMQGVLSAAVASGGGVLLTATGNGRNQSWRLQEGVCTGETSLEAGASQKLQMDSQGTRLLIDTEHGQELWDVANRARVATLLPNRPAPSRVYFSSCGRWLALCEADSLSSTLGVLLHDARTGAAIGQVSLYGLEEDWDLNACALAFSPDGARMAITAWNRVTYYTLPGGREDGHTIIPEQSDQAANHCCFSPDGHWLAMTAAGNAVVIAPVREPSEPLVLGAHAHPVTTLVFDETGERLFSGDGGGQVLVWDTISGRQLMSMPLLSEGVRFLVIDPVSRTLVAGDGVDTVLARTFPWLDDALPGTPATALPVRLAAYKTYSPALAPAWGRCQERMHRIEDEVIAESGQIAGGAASSCPEGGAYTVTEPGAPPVCAAHGPLGNPAHLLARALQYDGLVGGDSSRRADAVRKSLWNGLEDDLSTILSRARQWVFTERHMFRAARVACAKGFQVAGRGVDVSALAEVDCAAALALGDTDSAIARCRQFHGGTPVSARIMPELITALAQSGRADDVKQAFRLLCNHLEHYRADQELLEAVAVLRQRPEWADIDSTDLIGRLLHYDPESWRGLPWFHEMDEAMLRAAEEGKYLLFVVSVSDSAAMRRLREEIFSAPVIQDHLMEHFVLVETDPIRSPGIAEQYGLTSLPAIVALDAGGRLLRREPGNLLRGEFNAAFVHPFYEDAVLREWCIIGPFDHAGCADIESAPAVSHGLDLAGYYPGRDGSLSWGAYACPRVQSIVPISKLFLDPENSVFYAYSCFELDEPVDASLKLYFAEAGQAWLDGDPVSGYATPAPGQGADPVNVTLEAGRHEILLKLVSRWNPECRVVLTGGDTNEALDGLKACTLPGLAPLSILVSRRVAEETLPAVPLSQERATHVTVDKRHVLRLWRENYATYLAILNPRPYMEDGRLVGIQGDNLEQIPILAEAGVRNGDILISVNGYRAGEGHTVQEIAELTEGSNPYVLEVLRDGAVHTFIVHVEGY